MSRLPILRAAPSHTLPLQLTHTHTTHNSDRQQRDGSASSSAEKMEDGKVGGEEMNKKKTWGWFAGKSTEESEERSEE